MKSKRAQQKTERHEEPVQPHHHTYLEEESPNPDHDFPSVGRSPHEFMPSHNRSTHRMIDHEPGTI